MLVPSWVRLWRHRLFRAMKPRIKVPGLYVRDCVDNSLPPIWPIYCSILFSNLRFVSKISLCSLRKRLLIAVSEVQISLESFLFSMMICFLWSLGFGTLVRYAQSLPWLCFFWSFLFVARARSLLALRIFFTTGIVVCFFGTELFQIEFLRGVLI